MIYVVEDNEGIRETVRAYLELAGFAVEEFAGVTGVVESLQFKKPELCVLDVMLPDGNGFALAKKIREKDATVPFLFLTARESEGDRITGLELGADDYVVKPFSARELVLRIKNILHRAGRDASKAEKPRRWILGGHELRIDDSSHVAAIDGAEVRLTAVEWSILSYLTERSGSLVPRERILGECLDYAHDGSERTVNTHLKNIRAKLGDAQWIETVRGFGYKFVGDAIEGSPEASE